MDHDAKKLFFIFAGLNRRHAYFSKHIILKTNIIKFHKKS